MPFRSLGLEPRILQAVQQAGYTEPTPIQTAAIPQVLAGHDLIGIAQTGTGKTAAFTLPILTRLVSQLSSSAAHPDGPQENPSSRTEQHDANERAVGGASVPASRGSSEVCGLHKSARGDARPTVRWQPLSPSDGAREKAMGAGSSRRRGTRVLIVAPTRELVVQIEENVRAYARHLPLRVGTVFGGVGENPQKAALNEGADIIIATPGRLIDLMRRRFGDFSGLQFLVLDEADRMLDMGFLPSIRDIVHRLPRQRQTLMFSATFSKEIETLTHQFQRNPKTVQIGRRADPATTVTQLVYEVRNDLKMNLLLHLLRNPGLNMVLLFSRTKHGADKIARKLEERGIRTGTLHSNRSQNQRLRALKDFKNGSIRVLVATDIAARGIDVDGISHVVNYDFPKHPEDYVHRIGRTGRAHAVGDALSFATPEDHSALRALERFIGRGLVRKRADGFDYQSAPVQRREMPNRGNEPEIRQPHRRTARREEGRGEWQSDVRKPSVHGKHSTPRPVAASHGNANRPPGQRPQRPMATTQRHAARPQLQRPMRPQVQQSGVRPPQTGSQHSHGHGNAGETRVGGGAVSPSWAGHPRPTSKGAGNRYDRAHRRRQFHRRSKGSKPFWARR